MKRIAFAKIAFPFSLLCILAASSQTSSFLGQVSQPFMIRFLAAISFPVSCSRRAAAIQPGPCLGFVVMTLFNNKRAFLISCRSELDCTRTEEFKSVKYPFGSITVCPVTESATLSSFIPSILSLARPNCVRSFLPAPGVAYPGVIYPAGVAYPAGVDHPCRSPIPEGVCQPAGVAHPPDLAPGVIKPVGVDQPAGVIIPDTGVDIPEAYCVAPAPRPACLRILSGTGVKVCILETFFLLLRE
mmetsp:Transcript_4163/g.6155  ORF Transcript_4163/g.6155 Transcript_4163/m.6155 type:complete len:243 (+) Transcript_4163:1824-2552(+)